MWQCSQVMPTTLLGDASPTAPIALTLLLAWVNDPVQESSHTTNNHGEQVIVTIQLGHPRHGLTTQIHPWKIAPVFHHTMRLIRPQRMYPDLDMPISGKRFPHLARRHPYLAYFPHMEMVSTLR